MTKDEALDLALEALENSVDLVREDAYNAEKLYGNYPSRQGKVAGLKVLADDHEKAITAIKQARALDKKAENARELGLDYEPVPENFIDALKFDVAMRDAAPVQEPVFELQESGWEIICDLDWIQTLPFGTKLYTTPPAQPAPVQEPVAWMEMVVANLVREGVNKHKARELAEHFYSLAQRPFVGLTDEEIKDLCREASNFGTSSWIRHIESKLKEKNT